MASKSLWLCIVICTILVALQQPIIPIPIASADMVDILYGYQVPPVTIVESAVSKGAVCLDGSAPAYHFVEGLGEGKHKWMVYLLGGAWCPTSEDCKTRKNSHLGSSIKWNDTSRLQRFGGILHNISSKNPDFYSWNKVMVRYCDGSSFTGDAEIPDRDTDLYYRGKRVFDAVIGDLFTKGLKDAREVLLTGGSAGGLAVIIHCDPFAALFPTTTKVKCLSDGGFFLHSNNPLQAKGLESMFRETVELHNSTGALPEACKHKMKEGKAYLYMFPQYVVGDIKTPLLIMASAYDSYQINETLSTAVYLALKANQTSPTQYQVLRDFRLQVLDVVHKTTDKLSRGGVFINNCFTHTQLTFQGWNNLRFGVNNKTDVEVIRQWYFGGRNHVQEIDDTNSLVKCCDNGTYYT